MGVINKSVINKSVLVHSCRVKPDGLPRDLLVPGERYVGELGVDISQQSWYYPLCQKCRCKRRVTISEATDFVAYGWAVWLLKSLKKGVVFDDKRIWMPVVRERVPRIDLITRSDIERAYCGSDQKSKHYRYDSKLKRFITIRIIPEGMSKKDWLADAEREVKFERRIQRQFKQYIEDCHSVIMNARAELIVPFQPDPFEGRVLFPFNPDQRTAGGKGV